MKINNSHPDKLSGKDRKNLPLSAFGLPETREFPMPDATHVRAAEAYFRYAEEDKKPILAHRILLKAKKFDVQIQSETILKWAGMYKKK